MSSKPAEIGQGRNRGLDRRGFIKRIAGLGAQAAVGATAFVALATVMDRPIRHAGLRGKFGILRPPGAGPEEEFLAKCIHCSLCSDACEPQCIKYFGPGAGELQATPYIIPEDSACTMCLKCGEICPTGALKPLSEMEQIAMGTAVVDDRLCLPLANRGVCGACHMVCPLRNKAVTVGIRLAPTIHEEHCTGCGLCVEICLVQEPPAIQIQTTRASNPAAYRRSLT